MTGRNHATKGQGTPAGKEREKKTGRKETRAEKERTTGTPANRPPNLPSSNAFHILPLGLLQRASLDRLRLVSSVLLRRWGVVARRREGSGSGGRVTGRVVGG